MLVSKDKMKEEIELVIRKSEIEDEQTKYRLDYIANKKGNPLACIDLLGIPYEFKASKNWLFDKDVEQFKKDMYIYCKLNILGSETRGYLLYRPTMWNILSSNNRDLLNFAIRYVDYIAFEREKDRYVKSETYSFLLTTTLLALIGRWEDVIRRCDIYLNNPSKDSYHKYAYLEFEFLKALALNDVVKMKEKINEMLDKKVSKKMMSNMATGFEFYLNLFVISYAKIALYHGIDLGIDHEFAPKELIDITPASEYPEPYEFMKEFDFNTITPKEWLEWIYRYHSDPKELDKDIADGYFI